MSRRWLVLLGTSLAVSMVFLDGTITDIGFPALRRSFPDRFAGDAPRGS